MTSEPPSAVEAFALAVAHHQSGRLADAEALYRRILAANPQHAPSWNLLGVVQSQNGNHALAAEYLGRAIEINSRSPAVHNNLGNVYRALHQYDQATASFRRALALKPDFVEALSNLGSVLQYQGQRDEAVDCYQKSLAIAPDNPEVCNNLGALLQQQGQPREAAACYERALRLKPDYAEAHSNLGSVLTGQGRLEEAHAHLCRALELSPQNVQAHNHLGTLLRMRGERAAAIACYRRALALASDDPQSHNNLGNALQDEGRLPEAVEHYHRACALQPDVAEVHNNLGTALQALGNVDEAIACYEHALRLNPNYAEAYSNLGGALCERGRSDEGIDCFRRALTLKPALAEAHNNLGNALQKQRQLDEAEACFRSALEIRPDFARARNNLGNVCRDRDQLERAAAEYRRAVELDRDFAEAHSNLGSTLLDLGRPDEAMDCLRRAIDLRPDLAEAYNNLGNPLAELGRLDEAIACYRRAVELKPDYLAALSALVHLCQHTCQWQALEEQARRVIELVQREDGDALGVPLWPFSFITLPTPTSADQQLRCARHWALRQLHVPADSNRTMVDRQSRAGKPKITLGYLSADFHAHATAFLVAELLEKHDRTRFEVIGYSYGPDDGSPMRRRLVEAFDRFVELREASYDDAARQIAAHGVDILVDLKGYTKDARTQIMARRPAPVQVSYLGYPGTSGASFIDYILVDDFIVPPQQQPFYSEQLVYLPGCYQANDSQREIAATPTRAQCGLPESGFVFCSFNSIYKVTAAMFDVWMRLLTAVPDSVLWLLEGNRFAPVNLRREAEERGVDAERLVFAPNLPAADHLARYRLADLFLDTFPVTAHTTASDALWAGCPVLTLCGETFVSRVAGSLLRATGVADLVAARRGDYEQLALELARNRERLAELRARLAANRASSALFDGARFAKSVERAYERMWKRYIAGEPPEAFRVSQV